MGIGDPKLGEVKDNLVLEEMAKHGVRMSRQSNIEDQDRKVKAPVEHKEFLKRLPMIKPPKKGFVYDYFLMDDMIDRFELRYQKIRRTKRARKQEEKAQKYMEQFNTKRTRLERKNRRTSKTFLTKGIFNFVPRDLRRNS